ncbi:MAG: SDR family NAD(P)-dependent oxidoreductase [Oscillospiraceae bacterium]
MKTAIVTGGTSGLGLAAAQTLAAKGLRVYALSRHGAPVPGVTSLACDITDADAVERTVAAIEAEAERIDLVVNNAGFGISGAVECTTPGRHAVCSTSISSASSM